MDTLMCGIFTKKTRLRVAQWTKMGKTLTSTLLNDFEMNWNTNCTPDLLIQQQCHITDLTDAPVAEWASPHSDAPTSSRNPSQKSRG